MALAVFTVQKKAVSDMWYKRGRGPAVRQKQGNIRCRLSKGDGGTDDDVFGL